MDVRWYIIGVLICISLMIMIHILKETCFERLEERKHLSSSGLEALVVWKEVVFRLRPNRREGGSQ